MSTATVRSARPSIPVPLWPIGLAACAVGAITWTSLACRGTDAEGLQILNRFLARLGFLIYLPIYTASPLRTLVPGPATGWLVRMRRSLGLAYALVMATHLVAIVARYATPEVTLDVNIEEIGGGVGMALIGALAATSNDASVRRLGRRAWKGLHAATLHFVWIIYGVTYLGRVTERGPEYWPGLAVVLVLPCLRAVARRKERAA